MQVLKWSTFNTESFQFQFSKSTLTKLVLRVTGLCCLFLVFILPVRAELPDFTELAKEASPTVVNISTTQSIDPRANPYAMTPDLQGIPPIFRPFFEFHAPDPNQGYGQGQGRGQSEPQSLGSGFIISTDGYILTNNHVVEKANEIFVRLADRSELKAQLIGSDPRTDVALLKVEGKSLPMVKIGNSSQLKVGEWVVAIGSPFGFDHSITAGIVSAKGRSLPNENYVPFIQTDVAINPGNSGGPLFNLKGEVIGMNSQIFTRSGGSMGLSFAIPIDVAMNVVDQIKAKGYVERGWLGVMIQDINKDLAESFGMDRPAGALITEVAIGGPADHAGVRAGDVVTQANGHLIVYSSDLPQLVGSMKPGQSLDLTLLRSGKSDTISVKVGALPDDRNQVRMLTPPVNSKSTNALGLLVSALSEAQKQSLKTDTGVQIDQVQSGVGASLGLQVGDVITHLNNRSMDSQQVFTKVVKELPSNRSISMRVLRGGSASFITFKLD